MTKEISKLEIKKLIASESPLILDIGCYDGEDASELNNLFENAVTFCFEADPRSIALFKVKNRHNTSLMLQETAIGNTDEEIELFLSDSKTRRHYEDQHSWSASSSIKKPKYHLELFKDVYFKDSIHVPCKKLDTWYEGMDDIIDFVWVDINGAEEDFILGALNTLNKYTRYLYMEFSDKELYEGQITKSRILELLPLFEEKGIYNHKGNFGNILLANKTL